MWRAFWILIGGSYLAVLANVFAGVTRYPITVTGPIIVAAAVALMISLTLFSIRFAEHRGPWWRFNLGTTFLLMFSLAIYFAGIRWFLNSLRDWEEFRWEYMLGTVVFSSMFIFVSSAILQCMAEGIVFYSLEFLRGYRGNSKES